MVNWTEITETYPNFTSELQKKWETKGFTAEETKDWMEFGLEPAEVDFADWLKTKYNVTAEEFLGDDDMEELRERYKKELEEGSEESKEEEKQNSQDLLNQKYPKEKRENIKELYINEENLAGELDLSDFINLEKIFISHFVDENKLEIKAKEKFEDKIIKLKNTQKFLEEYLEKDYSGKQKSEIESLNFDNKNLEGELDLSDFINLTRLDCDNNKITRLKVNDCSRMKTLYCRFGQLTDLDLTNLTELENLYCQGNELTNINYPSNFKKLTNLYIQNNNFPEQDLSVFGKFTNLKNLYIGNDDKEKIEKGIYNRFYGSLKLLKELSKLSELNISYTNIDSGLEFLSDSIGTLTVISDDKFSVNKIKEQLTSCDNDIKIWREEREEWKKKGFNNEEINQWIDAGLAINEYELVDYLKKNNWDLYNADENDNKIQELIKEYWLDFNLKKEDNEILPEEDLTELDISNKNLKGELNLSNLTGLKSLNCSNNQLTSLILKGLTQLEKLSCNDNLLTEINYSDLPAEKLTYLNISNNNLSKKDLSVFKKFTNLEELQIGNNHEKKIKEGKYNNFVGSLEPLGKLHKLKILNISNTDVGNDLDSLSESVKKIYCSSKERPESGASNIAKSLRERKEFAFIDGKYKRLVNAQEWLDEKFPLNDESKLSEYKGKKRSEITKLDINGKLLEGPLKLKGFDNLEELNCYNNYLTDINSLLSDLNPEKLKALSLYDNNFSKSDLTPFCRFVNLKTLIISSSISRKEDHEENIINRFEGSLKPLENLTKLEALYIDNTDIDSGLEFLPESLETLSFDSKYWGKRPNAKASKFSKELSEYEKKEKYFYFKYDLLTWKRNRKWKNELTKEEVKEWKKYGLEENKIDFMAYLKVEGCKPSDESLRKKLEEAYQQAQTWLDWNYKKEEKENTRILRINNKNLKGKLDLSGFTSLEELNCGDNLIDELDLSSLNPEKLAHLDISNNILGEGGLNWKGSKDLSIFVNFKNLKTLKIGNDNKDKIDKGTYNHFSGSLDFLKELTKLENLHISNTDINEVNNLPEIIREINYSVEEKPDAKLKKVKQKLDSYQKKIDKYNGEQNKELLNKRYPKSTKRLWLGRWLGLKGHLDLSEYKDLENLYCEDIGLTSIDLSKNTKLKELNCSNNRLKELNLENNVNLEELNCSNNHLKDSQILGIENCNKLRKRESLKVEEGNEITNEYEEFLTRLIETNKVKGQWKKINAQEWLDKEYPKNDKCLGIVDLENIGKLRKDIKELNISGNELSGELKLEGFSKLKYLTCRDNQLEKIDLSDCSELVGLDCRNNKLTKLTFNVDCNLVELQASENEFEKLTDIFRKIEDHSYRSRNNYSASTLSYFNVNNNKIRDGEIKVFAKFKNLVHLFIGNDFSGNEFNDEKKNSLKYLEKLEKLEEIDIRNNGIKIEKFLEGAEKSKVLKELKKIYYLPKDTSKEDASRSGDPKENSEILEELEEELKKYQLIYDKKDNYCRQSSGNQRTVGITSVIRVPILNVDESKEIQKEINDYSIDGRLIYPSEEAGFKWETIGELPLSKLPVRLYSIDSHQVVNNDLLSEKKEKLDRYNLEKDFEEKNNKGNRRTSAELYEIKNLLKDIISLKSKEEKKYEDYLQRISSLQKEVHKNSIRVRTFESLAETDEERIKKWEERHQKEKVNSLYQIYDEYQKIEKLIKLTPQQEDSKKAVRREIKKKEDYKEWQNRLEDIGLSEAFTDEVIDRWKSENNFDIAGDVKNLFSLIINKEDEFNQFIKDKKKKEEKSYLSYLKELVARKFPKQVITIIKSFEYEQIHDKSKLEEKISKYCSEKVENLSKNQINEYLYKEAIGKIKEEKEEVSSPSSKIEKPDSIKRRVEFIDNKTGENIAKQYAILSYTWDGEANETIKWSPETALSRLSPGGEKSLNKALSALKVLNNFHLFKNKVKKGGKNSDKIKYLWMDQLCINQDNPHEKQHEVPKMREYYGNSTVTLVAIHEIIGETTMKKFLNSFGRGKSGLINPSEIVKYSLPILKKIIDSNWFKRSWTFQEGFLSKQTIFMFDDFLIDGRFMALIWKLKQFSETRYEECKDIRELCEEKIATPVGWTYFEWKGNGYTLSDQASLRLNEGLWAVKDRGRKYAIDGIYSIVGLLPYGSEVKVNYDRDPESALRDIMLIAMERGHGEPLAWHGSGNKKVGLCWIPEVVSNGNSSGSSNVKGSIEVDYDKGDKENLVFDEILDEKGIKIKGLEYTIGWRDNCIYRAEVGETVDGGLWRRKVWIKKDKNDEKGVVLNLSGTKEGVEAADKGRMLIVPNKNVWKSKVPFAILALRIRNRGGLGESGLKIIRDYFKENPSVQEIRLNNDVELVSESIDKKNVPNNLDEKNQKEIKEILQNQVGKLINKDELFSVRHRLDLVRIEEGSEELEKLLEEKKVTEKEFIIGFNNQDNTEQFQAQIEINPYQK